MPSVQQLLQKKTLGVISVTEDATVLDAARCMSDKRVGAVVVTRDDKVVGIFTERDILCRVVAEQRDPDQTPVSSVMTTPVAVCAPETTRDECRSVMRERRLRHLPVVSGGRLVGMISIGDLNEAIAAEQAATIQYLHEYLYGEWK